MSIWKFIEENEEDILNKWYFYLSSCDSQRYSNLNFDDFKPRLQNIFSALDDCREGTLPTESQQFIYYLAQERMSQEYNYAELLNVFRTLRQAIAELAGPLLPAMDCAEYEKLIRVFEEAYQKLSEGYLDYQISVIEALHKNLLELSTPVIPIEEQILVLPLIGTIDTFRANQIMESILTEVTTHKAEIVIIDITGVPMVDSAVANHLLRTVKAVKLVGGKCILVGIRPEIAQTMVRLDLAFPELVTAGTLAKGLDLAHKMLRAEK